MNLESFLADRRDLVDRALDDALPLANTEPAVLHEAMRYSVFAGGKRIRPILALAAADAVMETPVTVLPLAVALECIHTYSLIHDDLPSMDDDDLRRGKPTSHRVFGEAVAILAGDALLTLAFGILSSPHAIRTYRLDRLISAIGDLAYAAGSQRLVAGQVLDLTSEGTPVEANVIEEIMRNKTGALIRASLTCGATLAGGSQEQIEILGRYGEDLGVIFQIRDDLLDWEGDPGRLGKAVQKDGIRGKATYPNLVGEERTGEMLKERVKSALDVIRPLGAGAERLTAIGRYIGERLS